jgi:hypothetical protein
VVGVARQNEAGAVGLADELVDDVVAVVVVAVAALGRTDARLDAARAASPALPAVTVPPELEPASAGRPP